MRGSLFSKTFFNIFPPPAYINLPHAGIDISESAIRCIELRKSAHRGGWVVAKYASLELPMGIIDAGFVKDEIALTAAIAEISKKLGVYKVRASLPEEKTYLFRTPIPSHSPREVAQNIESKLEENVPLTPDKAIFNFQFIQQPTAPISASVSVVPAKVVDVYLRAFKAAGVSVFGFDTKARAIASAVVPQSSDETVLVIYGTSVANVYSKIDVCIVYRGVVCFSSTISIQSDLTEDLLKGIRNIISFWFEHGEALEGKSTVDRFVVCGDVFLSNAVKAVSAQITIPFSMANVWINAFTTGKYAPPITAEESYAYAVAAGLALPSSNQ